MTLVVKKIEGHKIALILGIATALFTLIFVPIYIAMFKLTPSTSDNRIGMLLFAMPAIYFIFVYLFTRLFIFIFNFISTKLNGFKVEIEELNSETKMIQN